MISATLIYMESSLTVFYRTLITIYYLSYYEICYRFFLGIIVIFMDDILNKAKMQREPLGFGVVANWPPGILISRHNHLGFINL